jgi:hypothetical protein
MRHIELQVFTEFFDILQQPSTGLNSLDPAFNLKPKHSGRPPGPRSSPFFHFAFLIFHWFNPLISNAHFVDYFASVHKCSADLNFHSAFLTPLSRSRPL